MNRKPRSTSTQRPSTRKPSARPAGGADLSALFNVATQALAANQTSLNQADQENHNHGDNMVQAFTLISEAMANQRGATPSKQLRNASKVLAENANSGSAQVYAQGLAQAAQQLKGQRAVTPDNATALIQSLLTGGQGPAPQAGGDLLRALLGGQQGGTGELGLDDLLSAGMSFMNAKQQGQDNMQAALTALMSAGPMAQKPHRQQSGQLVANALLQAVAAMASRKR